MSHALPQRRPIGRIRRDHLQQIAHHLRPAPQSRLHRIMRRKKTKFYFRSVRPLFPFRQRQLRKCPQPQQSLDETRLTAAIGTDDEVKRQQRQARFPQRFEFSKCDGGDHGRTFSTTARKINLRRFPAMRRCGPCWKRGSEHDSPPAGRNNAQSKLAAPSVRRKPRGTNHSRQPRSHYFPPPISLLKSSDALSVTPDFSSARAAIA